WVGNTTQGVLAEFEGERDRLERCLLRLGRERPPLALVQSLEPSWLDPVPLQGFTIRESRDEGAVATLVMPDVATCDACLADITDPRNRRYRYPFTNCTNCGPRFSIIRALPYDRPNTSMSGFTMCAACQREYDDPADRRFHAQPNACPVCGPTLRLWNARGAVMAAGDDALGQTARVLRDGGIVALKGLGGFQLLVDAANAHAVARLRQRKHREEKPFAVMCPSLASVEGLCEVAPLEHRLLEAPEAPIVLLRRRAGTHGVADGVAPGTVNLGVMLPYTPLHHLLLGEMQRPVVCTSGNISDEPMVIDEVEAVSRLGGIADVFLVHDRPIVRHVDDSIMRVMLGRELVLRRARGYAPLPVDLDTPQPPMLAVGGHLKNTVAVTAGRHVFVSQHLGDLEHQRARDSFHEAQSSLRGLLRVQPELIAADAHQGYASTLFARATGLPVELVQHHFAHVMACLAENHLAPPALGVPWDGTGDGQDGTIWGGEFLRANRDATFTRVAALRPFRLPGGEAAVREPRRTALGVLFEIFGPALADAPHLAGGFERAERHLAVLALARNVNSPVTTSAGRLFDAIAALLGVCQRMTYEGQAAMALEAAVDESEAGEYPMPLVATDARHALTADWLRPEWILDWEPMVRGLIGDRDAGRPAGQLAARVHNTLARAIVAVAERAGESRVALTGGCFQNRVLTERTVQALTAAGFRACWHQRVPPNDGGLALGQIAAVTARLAACAAAERTRRTVAPIAPGTLHS
ncbi:MAG TPA: carbamoyltransferase HypF, partial [Vicinamibacterales bacterium]|nr:carbamoyltransferase HypF [Vicinamibacterales bacterium]